MLFRSIVAEQVLKWYYICLSLYADFVPFLPLPLRAKVSSEVYQSALRHPLYSRISAVSHRILVHLYTVLEEVCG